MSFTRDELLELKELISYYMLVDIMDLKDETYMNKIVISIANRISVCDSITKKINSMLEKEKSIF